MHVFVHNSEYRLYTPGMILRFDPSTRKIMAKMDVIMKESLDSGLVFEECFIQRNEEEFFIARMINGVATVIGKSMNAVPGIYSQDDHALLMAENIVDILKAELSPKNKIVAFTSTSGARVICSHNYFVTDDGHVDIKNPEKVPPRLVDMTFGRETFDSVFDELRLNPGRP